MSRNVFPGVGRPDIPSFPCGTGGAVRLPTLFIISAVFFGLCTGCAHHFSYTGKNTENPT
jgi:hypothetical protein